MRKKFLVGFCLILLVFSCMLSLVACKHEHSWDIDWAIDETNHWHECTKKNCKADHAKAAHAFIEDRNSIFHWQECDVCGYIKDKEEHKWDSNLVCTDCGIVHTHSFSYDDKKHRYDCYGCGLTGQESEHTFSKGVCTVCSYHQGTKELEFELNDDGSTYKVVGIDSDIENPITNVIIPEYYEGKKVTVIGANAFDSNVSISKITIPKTIMEIENNAFARCSGLAEIVIPKSVNKIGARVFEDCYGITIKAEVKSAPSGWNTSDWQINQWCDIPVVWDCNNNDATKDGSIYFLYEVEDNAQTDKYAQRVKYVIRGGKAYIAKQPRILVKNDRTGKLETRSYLEFKPTIIYNDIKYDVIGIEDYALYNYESIEEIEIKATYKTIGNNAFEGCTNLKEVLWKEDTTDTKNIEIEIGMCAFRNATSLNKINLPTKIVKIGGYAFSGCTRLKEITIPSSVREVKEGAFEDCLAIVIKCDVATQPNGWDSEWNIGNRPVIWDASSGNVSTGDGKVVYEVGSAVYLLDSSNYTATLLSQGELIDSTLTIASTIYYPNDENEYKLTSIGASAFVGETFFTNIVIPASVETIGEYAFSGCTNIEEITFAGNKIEKIGANAFADCEKLEKFIFVGTEEEWMAIEKGKNWDLNTPAYKIMLGDNSTIEK